MNRMMMMTISVVVVLCCIVISVSSLSEDVNKQVMEETTQTDIQEEYAAAEQRRNQRMAQQSAQQAMQESIQQDRNLASVRAEIGVVRGEMQSVSRRIANLEREQQQSSSNRASSDEKTMSCDVAGYLDANNRQLSEAEVRSSDLNEDLRTGKKKVSLVCTFN